MSTIRSFHLLRSSAARTLNSPASRAPRLQLDRALPPPLVSGAPIHHHHHIFGAVRCKGSSAGGANDYQFGPVNDLQPQPNTQTVGLTKPLTSSTDKRNKERKSKKDDEEEDDDHEDGPSVKGNGRRKADDDHRHGTHNPPGTGWRMFESAATTFASLTVLG